MLINLVTKLKIFLTAEYMASLVAILYTCKVVRVKLSLKNIFRVLYFLKQKYF